VLFPCRFFATKDLVVLFGTSEDLAIGISIFFTTTGLEEGVGADDGVEDCETDGVGVAMAFPESHTSAVLPLILPFTQVKSFPLYVVVWPKWRQAIVGLVAPNAGNTDDRIVEINPSPIMRREIKLIVKSYFG